MGRILAIDVGNIHTALALWEGDHAVRHWRLASNPRRSPDEYRVLLSRLFEPEELSPDAIEGSVMACVVPALCQTLRDTCRSVLGHEPLVVGPGVRSGLRIRTDDPREVGPDRVANAVAAVARRGSPVLVIDFTMALIIDVIDANGDYVGAIIAPGPEIAADALAERTAQLQRIELRPPESAIGRTTVANLQSGLVYGYVGLVEGLVSRARGEVGPAPVIATGEAPWIPSLLELTTAVDEYDPLLTLDGLRRIFVRHHTRSPS